MLRLGGLGTVLIVGFVIWCLLAPTKGMRLERGCQPVDWFGNMTISLVVMTLPERVETFDYAFAKTDYGCQYILWRLFYESAWQEAIAQGKINPETGDPMAESSGKANVSAANRSRVQNERPIDYPLGG